MLNVALYGSSLVLASIAARLERRAGLPSATIDADLPGAIEKLREMQPDVVVLDMSAAHSEDVVALWKARPELLLIGVDLGADRMLVLSGQPARALTAEGLTEILATRSGDCLQARANDRSNS